ncbi:hypothetical protein [Methanobrevibacter oralis]|nr:hypothetical protein [Methanobrevibacter oralis]
MAKKDLVYTKIKPPTNKKEIKRIFIIKNANQTYKIVFKKLKTLA